MSQRRGTLWHKKLSILMSQKLNILMSHMFQKQATTLEISTLGASYRSSRVITEFLKH